MCVKYQHLMIIILYPQSPWVLAPPEAGSSMTPVTPMENLQASQLLETPPSAAASMPPVYSAMGGPLLAGSPQLESIPSIQQQQQPQQQHDNVRAKSKLENVNVTRPTYFWLNI